MRIGTRKREEEEEGQEEEEGLYLRIETRKRVQTNEEIGSSDFDKKRDVRDSDGSAVGCPLSKRGKAKDRCSKVIIGFPVSIPSALVKR